LPGADTFGSIPASLMTVPPQESSASRPRERGDP
jgi:hypothetical protein